MRWSRRDALQALAGAAAPAAFAAEEPPVEMAALCKRLKPVGRVLELEGWYVWCTSAIDGPDGRVHLFSSRWPASTKMGGWLTHCEIVHAVGARAEGPFEVRGVALRNRDKGHWDSTSVHNPTIHRIGGVYHLVHIGNSTGEPGSQRIGLARAKSLDGPWERLEQPILGPAPGDGWDSWYVTNPALLAHPNGEFWLYYKARDPKDKDMFRIGLAVAKRPEGPYRRHPKNPIIDFASVRKRFEDPYVWHENNRFYMVAADDYPRGGILRTHAGLLFESADGVDWSKPKLAYDTNDSYLKEPRGRLERPQVLVRNGKAAYLYLAAGGGRYGTATGMCLRVEQDAIT